MFPEVHWLLDNERFGFHWHAEWILNSCRALRPGPEKTGLDLSLGSVSLCCHWDFGSTWQCSPELWCMDDLFFQKERRLALLCKQRKLTRSHSWASLLFVSGNPALQNRQPFFPPHTVVGFVFLILNLCLLLGMKCEILPRLHIFFCWSSSQQSGGAGLKMFVHLQKYGQHAGQGQNSPHQWEKVTHPDGCREECCFPSCTTYMVATSLNVQFKLMMKIPCK